MFADISEISMERSEDVMTGVRSVQVTVRENDVHKIPYSAECDLPGRPPKCFRCEQIGHIRSQCPNDIVAVGRRPRRSFAGVVAGVAGVAIAWPHGHGIDGRGRGPWP